MPADLAWSSRSRIWVGSSRAANSSITSSAFWIRTPANVIDIALGVLREAARPLLTARTACFRSWSSMRPISGTSSEAAVEGRVGDAARQGGLEVEGGLRGGVGEGWGEVRTLQVRQPAAEGLQRLRGEAAGVQLLLSLATQIADQAARRLWVWEERRELSVTLRPSACWPAVTMPIACCETCL